MFKPGYKPTAEARLKMSIVRKAKLLEMRLTSVFYNNINASTIDRCWQWNGPINPENGYGVCIRKICGTRIVHRISYAICVGDLVPGLQIDHLCKNRLCVNPGHLEQVTAAVNMYRRRRTYCKHGHEYAKTGETVTYRENGFIRSRTCQECSRIWDRNHPRISTIDRRLKTL